MRVFIGWSRAVSQQVALALRDWLKKVIQSVDPWMSDKDIESGARWSDEIATTLKNAHFGIICLTPENKDTPWIHFEAGAISKSFNEAHVCPYLFDLEPTDIVGPLTQFQARRADKDGTRKLVETITLHPDLRDHLSKTDVEEVFEVWWPKLEKRLGQIEVADRLKEPRRPLPDMVSETLSLVRELVRNTSPVPWESGVREDD
jgi:hypothetical protein